MELGVFSFGDIKTDPETGRRRSTGEAIRALLEAIVLADNVGLDYFGVGEHHTEQFPASSPATVLAAAAAATRRIRLGSSVTVLSTDDPVRVFQQFATVDAISGGRAEITAGRVRRSSPSRCSGMTSRITTGSTPRSWTCCCG